MAVTFDAMLQRQFLAAATRGLGDKRTHEAMTSAILTQIVVSIDLFQAGPSHTNVDDQEKGAAAAALKAGSVQLAPEVAAIKGEVGGRAHRDYFRQRDFDDVLTATRAGFAKDRLAQTLIAIKAASNGLQEARIGEGRVDAAHVTMEVKQRLGFRPNRGAFRLSVTRPRKREGWERRVQWRGEFVDVLGNDTRHDMNDRGKSVRGI